MQTSMSDEGRSGQTGRMTRQPVPPRLRWVSEMIWRSALVVAALAFVGFLLWRLRVVFLPVFVAVLLSTVLTTPVVRLERRGWNSALATMVVFGGFLLAAVGLLVVLVPPVADGVMQFDDSTSAVDDLENWLVEGPLGLEREDVTPYTSDPVGRAIELLQESSVSISSGARVVGETLIGVLLTLVLTFFMLKDGRRFQKWALQRLEGRRKLLVREVAASAWTTFGGFLRGAAILGVVEGIVIGVTVWLVGAPLALPIAVITFLGAFFPIVGAITAGALAVVVVFTAQGVVPALIVLGVAVLVQQLDNDLLAPFIYGQVLNLHPAAILLVLTAGGALGGIAGAFIAVPITAALAAAAGKFWESRDVIDEIGPAPVAAADDPRVLEP
jgi:predicted PurR-regulated permease PerM